jgi:mRNA-degrading endonuclease RelE of RelBE toxin-antitoxin system
MKVDYSERAGRTLDGLTPQLRKAVYKQVKLLEQNLRHPSLRAKKYDESRNIWQARVNKDWRFYFLIQDDVCYIIDIIPHPK